MEHRFSMEMLQPSAFGETVTEYSFVVGATVPLIKLLDRPTGKAIN